MKAVYSGRFPNGELIIRYPNMSDATAMCDYINALSQEQTFIRFQGEKISLAEETMFLENTLAKIQQLGAVMLLGFLNNKLVAVSGIEMKDKTESHEGVLGISLSAAVRGQGIGKLLMELILKEAANIPDLLLVTLEVFSINQVAINLYQKCGFVKYGLLPGGVKYKDGFVDRLLMYKSMVNA